MIKICIVEDDEEIRELTKSVLELKPDIKILHWFTSAESYLEVMSSIKVDMILMDIGLPGISGIECVRKASEQDPHLVFVMYTTHLESSEVFEALQAGAKGYILKGGLPERLIQDIYDIAEGGSPMSPQISRMVAESFNQHPNKSTPLEKLSKHELEVLISLDKGMNYKEIAEQRFVSAHTVRAQIRSIYEKLHVHSKLEAIRMMRSN